MASRWRALIESSSMEMDLGFKVQGSLGGSLGVRVLSLDLKVEGSELRAKAQGFKVESSRVKG